MVSRLITSRLTLNDLAVLESKQSRLTIESMPKLAFSGDFEEKRNPDR